MKAIAASLRNAASKRDVWAGMLMMVIGLGAADEGRHYAVGTLTDMGTGFLPIVLGMLLALLGLVIAAGGVLSPSADAGHGADLAAPDLRGCSAIVAGLLAFLVLGEYAGLAPATFACVFMAAMGDRGSTVAGALVLALAMTAIAAGLFWYLLQVQFPLVRW